MTTSMRARHVTLAFAFALGGALAATGACSNNVQMSSGRGGNAGTGVATGAVGGRVPAGDGGAGGAVAGGGAGAGGSSAGSGGMLTPQQIHDGLLNAPTNGGVDVTRTPLTTYPTCQQQP